MDPRIVAPPRRALTGWKIGRAVAFLVVAAALLIGGIVARVQGDGIATPLLTWGIVLLVLAMIYVALLMRLHRLDRQNRFGIPRK